MRLALVLAAASLLSAPAVLARSEALAARSGGALEPLAYEPAPRRRAHAQTDADLVEARDAAEVAPAVVRDDGAETRDLVDTAAQGYLAARDSPRFRYGGPDQGADTVRGVSTGGWLVLESFITPGVFDATGPLSQTGVVDEWTWGKNLERGKATRVLQKHLNTFYSEQDFKDMRAANLNHVRIPIGYWAFDVRDNEPFIKLNQFDLLKQACIWAGNAGLKVLIDLHGAPGSQNGFDHSGRKRSRQHWTDKQSNIDRTLDIISTMAREFSQDKYRNSVAAIELLNEPNGMSLDVLKQYYRDGYARVRKYSGDIAVVLSPGFQDPSTGKTWRDNWSGFMTAGEGYQNVIEDAHPYTIFTVPQIRMKAQDRQNVYCGKRQAYRDANRSSKWLVVGEWSPAFTDCAINLNGRGVGSRYDGTHPDAQGQKYGSCATKRGPAERWSAGYKRLLARFWSVQRDAYSVGSGFVMWCWKTQAGYAEEWSYQKGLQHGWIPRDAASGSVSDFHC